MVEEGEKNLIHMTEEKIEFGEKLLQSLVGLRHFDGILKISNSGLLKKEHLQCSNLTHFSALINTLSNVDNCLAVNKVFNLNDRKITIDIICDGGLTWVKVVARNPKSIKQICLGDGSYGVRSVLDQAYDYLECAQIYPCLFQTPKIIFIFANGIYEDLAKHLESIGIIVKGERLVDEDFTEYEDIQQVQLSTKDISEIKKVNLDVSAMLAYVSSVTNGSCLKYKLQTQVLAQQAEWEAKRPVKPVLDAFFKDKTLYCCETARNSFLEILNTVGGPNEIQRGEELLKRINVLPDNATSSDTLDKSPVNAIFNNVQLLPNRQLKVGGKIKERSFIIFTFGDRIQAVTVTANDGFVRAAKQQGINFVVFVHESRALTEQKEFKAEKI
ncbi:UPF0415 protein C7orf25 homolog isoform X2 [Agrilus planipennis]|uniref:UPF0415 protein C7orf25 homolog isoform X2 n=1 Tax=Agrilus planipennis TaxID=224129 RepID=A0A1W4X4C8_AGRPL|nr:UPF0415 protein C7orf25 homolog isoform X2 [Agrilus planipennis]